MWRFKLARRGAVAVKCWHTEALDGEHQRLVFAEKRSAAILMSEAYEWEGDYISVRTRRQPQYDKYAEQGYVPKVVLIADGWWFECCGYKEDGRICCRQLTEEDNPMIIDERVYCGQDCAFNKRGEALR